MTRQEFREHTKTGLMILLIFEVMSLIFWGPIVTVKWNAVVAIIAALALCAGSVFVQRRE